MKKLWASHSADVAAPRNGKDERKHRTFMTGTLSPVLKNASMAAVVAVPRICLPLGASELKL